MKTVAPSDAIPPRLLAKLGALVVDWAWVEEYQLILLAHFVGADPAGLRIVTQQASASAVTDWLRTAIRHREAKILAEPSRQILELLRRLDELRIQRNNVVHGQWFVQQSSNEVHVGAYKPRRAVPDERFPAEPALDVLLPAVRDLLTNLARVARLLGLRK